MSASLASRRHSGRLAPPCIVRVPAAVPNLAAGGLRALLRALLDPDVLRRLSGGGACAARAPALPQRGRYQGRGQSLAYPLLGERLSHTSPTATDCAIVRLGVTPPTQCLPMSVSSSDDGPSRSLQAWPSRWVPSSSCPSTCSSNWPRAGKGATHPYGFPTGVCRLPTVLEPATRPAHASSACPAPPRSGVRLLFPYGLRNHRV